MSWVARPHNHPNHPEKDVRNDADKAYFRKTPSLFAIQKHQGGSDVGSPQGRFLRRSSLSGIRGLVGLAQAGAGVRIKCRGCQPPGSHPCRTPRSPS